MADLMTKLDTFPPAAKGALNIKDGVYVLRRVWVQRARQYKYVCFDAKSGVLYLAILADITRDMRVRNMLATVSDNNNVVMKLGVHDDERLGVSNETDQLFAYSAKDKYMFGYNYKSNKLRMFGTKIQHEGYFSDKGIEACITIRQNKMAVADIVKRYAVIPTEAAHLLSLASSTYFADSYHDFVRLEALKTNYQDCCMIAVTLRDIFNMTGNVIDSLYDIDGIGAKADEFCRLTVNHLHDISPRRMKYFDMIRAPKLEDTAFILGVRPKYVEGCTSRKEVVAKLNNFFSHWERNEKVTDYVDNAMTILNV